MMTIVTRQVMLNVPRLGVLCITLDRDRPLTLLMVLAKLHQTRDARHNERSVLVLHRVVDFIVHGAVAAQDTLNERILGRSPDADTIERDAHEVSGQTLQRRVDSYTLNLAHEPLEVERIAYARIRI